jgi:hypothetical protein
MPLDAVAVTELENGADVTQPVGAKFDQVTESAADGRAEPL